MRGRIVYIALVVLWLIVIFTFSSQQGYVSKDTSTKVAKFIQTSVTEKVEIDDKTDIHYIVRKTGHILVYFVLTLIFMGLFKSFGFQDVSIFFLSWVLSTFIALADEYNQSLIPGRDGRLNDVVIDTIGIVLGFLSIILIRKIINKFKEVM